MQGVAPLCLSIPAVDMDVDDPSVAAASSGTCLLHSVQILIFDRLTVFRCVRSCPVAETENFDCFGRQSAGEATVSDTSRRPWERQVHLLRKRHARFQSSLGSSVPGLLSISQPLSCTDMSCLMSCSRV